MRSEVSQHPLILSSTSVLAMPFTLLPRGPAAWIALVSGFDHNLTMLEPPVMHGRGTSIREVDT